MTLARQLRIAFAAVAVATAAGSAALAAVPLPHRGHAFAVTSTLDGKTVLPHRIHWLGSAALPRTRVREVAFLIDGKVRWIEHSPPYSYSEDGGYLVTSWLSAGRHRFTVRVRSTDGSTGTDTVLARVVSAPPPPAELAGTWQRRVAETVSDPLGHGDAPAGTWRLVFDRRWIQDHAPGVWNPRTSPRTGFGGIVDNDWVPGSKTFQIAGGVTTGVVGDEDAEGGWWCNPGGPVARYSWSVSGDTLTLAPNGGADPCYQRGAVYTGTWTRVH
jgi:hypothetical protein